MSPTAENALLIALVGEGAGAEAAELAEFLRAAAERGDITLVDAAADPVAPIAPAARIVVLRGLAADAAAKWQGREPDLILSAADPATPVRLQQACAEYGEWTRVGLWGGASGAVEMSIGATLHAVKFPLRGAALASVQAAMLTSASAKLNPPGRVVWVAFISSGLKAFSPGGGRVRPMVAIAMQGTLFGGAVQLLGWNALAVAIGGALIGAWAALQGVVLQYLLLGDDLVVTYSKATEWLMAHREVAAPSLAAVIVAWAVVHACAGAVMALAAWYWREAPHWLQARLANPAAAISHTMPEQRRWRRVARELRRWQFWLPLLVVAVALLLMGRPWEKVLWLTVRFVAVGAVLLSVLSLFQPASIARALRRRGWWGPAVAFSEALQRRKPPSA
ncbi:MAG: hypothetical protein KF715_12395 [Candidatus Didemnitutus sp.]|nr:hypothetical protein [Candidatus Didemnitutus sp.]